MKYNLPGIWVRLGFLGAIVWVIFAIADMPNFATSAKAKIDITALIVLGIVVILALGLAVQWIADYVVRKREDRQSED